MFNLHVIYFFLQILCTHTHTHARARPDMINEDQESEVQSIEEKLTEVYFEVRSASTLTRSLYTLSLLSHFYNNYLTQFTQPHH